MEQAYLVAKADRSWKNISQHQDERGQGRSTARNGKALASGGGALIGATYGASSLFPQIGTPHEGVKDLVNVGRRYKAMGKVAAEQTDPELAQMVRGMRSATGKVGLKQAIKRNPSMFAAGLGATGIGVGSGMWAAGRTKARRSEANIARLRRERARR